MRNRCVTFGQASRIRHQPGGQQNRKIRGGGPHPALAQPVFQAGGSFDGRGHGEKQERERQNVVSGQQQSGGSSQSGQRGERGNDEQALAPGDRHAENREEQQDRCGHPGVNRVET